MRKHKGPFIELHEVRPGMRVSQGKVGPQWGHGHGALLMSGHFCCCDAVEVAVFLYCIFLPITPYRDHLCFNINISMTWWLFIVLWSEVEEARQVTPKYKLPPE